MGISLAAAVTSVKLSAGVVTPITLAGPNNTAIILDGGLRGPIGLTGATGAGGAAGASGVGIPTGGTAGQVLSKIDSTNYNTQWVNSSGSDATKLFNLGPTQARSANFTAVVNNRYSVDTTSGNITATLPATGALGNTIFVQKSDATTNILYLSGNINGVSTSTFPLRTQLQGKFLQWDGVSTWNVISGDLSLPSLDSRYILPTTKGDLYGYSTTAARIPVGSNGQVLTADSTNANGVSWQPAGSGTGTVTSASVVSANGFAGTVATPTTTPAITVSTSVSGVLKGNGTAISAAAAGIDYQAPITLTTSGTSGAATLVSNTLNIPQYSAGGGGDASTNTSTSVDGEVTLFSGTAGKTLKRATGTGLAKLTSGVLSVGTSGTDYSAGTSGLATGIIKSTTATGALTVAVAADFPTLNQNTTGTSANVTGTVAIANGGTAATTSQGAINATNPHTSLGDISYRDASNVTRLPGNTTSAKQFLTQTGTGAVSAAPAWGAIAAGDVPTLNQSTTGNATTATTASAANALNSATTTVNVNAATAPTSGQVLTATSTTAATWQTPSGGASPLTTKGDLYTYSTTAARLPVGTDGFALVADSTQTTGIKWATVAGGTNSYYNQLAGSQANLTSSGYPSLTGSVNGSNTAFTVSGGVYVALTLRVWLNGVFQVPGDAIAETTPGSGIFNFITAPVTGDQIFASYQNQTITTAPQPKRIVALTDAATILVNGATTDIGTVTIAGNRTMGVPSGTPYDGQQIQFRITQDATGGRTMTWPSIYAFSNGTPTPLSTGAGKSDYFGFQYNSTSAKYEQLGQALTL